MLLLRVALCSGAVLAAATAVAATTTLGVEPGLWEVTTKVDMSGGMSAVPPEVYDRMSPSQRAQIEARMDQSRQPQTKRECITRAQIEKGLHLADESRGRCRTTLVSSSRSAMVVKVACSGNMSSSTGTMRFAATDGKTMTGRFEMSATSTRSDTAIAIKGTMRGRWLGADCGNVRPRTAQ